MSLSYSTCNSASYICFPPLPGSTKAEMASYSLRRVLLPAWHLQTAGVHCRHISSKVDSRRPRPLSPPSHNDLQRQGWGGTVWSFKSRLLDSLTLWLCSLSHYVRLKHLPGLGLGGGACDQAQLSIAETAQGAECLVPDHLAPSPNLLWEDGELSGPSETRWVPAQAKPTAGVTGALFFGVYFMSCNPHNGLLLSPCERCGN